ncbi:MAG TPA: hypothetical protein VLB09_04205 [Nitrospiria bacterium]|nr:hypothetical protein [Nitrospiria bacterium]
MFEIPGAWIAGTSVFLFLFVAPAFSGKPLPRGFEEASWGMTVGQLREQIEVRKADPSNGFGYAEHMEEDPEVYLRFGPHGERIEYYFFKEELYKIFVVYDRILFHTRFYDELAKEMEDSFGPPGRVFEEKFFGLDIQHTLWEDSGSVLDLRKGAGFIYQVRIDKKRNDEKKKAIARRKSI